MLSAHLGEVSERALREIYLKPFQTAIKNANPWAVMSAYVVFKNHYTTRVFTGDAPD